MKKTIKSLFFLLCIIFLQGYAASNVRAKMAGILTSDSLHQAFLDSDPYQKRYILKYMPYWLEKRGVSYLPAWVDGAVNYSLYANDAMLIYEAVSFAGIFKMRGYSGRFMQLYDEAHRKHPADAIRIRNAVIDALDNIGGIEADTTIPQLLKYKPYYCLDDEFIKLVSAVGRHGDSTHAGDLKNIEDMLNDIIAGIDKDNDPGRYYERYSEVYKIVAEVRNALERKGGLK